MPGQLSLLPDLAGLKTASTSPVAEKRQQNHGPPAQTGPTAAHGGQAAAHGARLLANGYLTVTKCEDGRVLLSIHTTRGDGWLELLPSDRAWLAGALTAAA